MAANYGVIAWKVQGGEPLNPEEMEVALQAFKVNH